MMSLQDELDAAFKAALKNQESLKLSVLRMLRTALKNRAVELRRPLEEIEILAVINSQVKQRREAPGSTNAAADSIWLTKKRRNCSSSSLFCPSN